MRRRISFAPALDADLADMAALRGAPPKMIWLRYGNKPTAVVEAPLRDRGAVIASFMDVADAARLEIYG